MFFLFDVGGTHTRTGFSRDGVNFEGDSVVSDTPQRYEEGIELLVSQAKPYLSPGQLRLAAGGLPGTIDQERGMLSQAPHLADWVGKPFVADLSAALGTDVIVENDAALAGLGEALHGAGKGSGIVAYLTVSTGVGGARIVGGEIDRRHIGFEPGHQVISYHDHTYVTLESLVSGSGIERKFGKKPETITDEAFWKDVTEAFAVGVANVILLWAPDTVVIGGALKDRIALPVLTERLGDIITILPKLPPIVLAGLGTSGGLYGALQLGRVKASREIM